MRVAHFVFSHYVTSWALSRVSGGGLDRISNQLCVPIAYGAQRRSPASLPLFFFFPASSSKIVFISGMCPSNKPRLRAIAKLSSETSCAPRSGSPFFLRVPQPQQRWLICKGGFGFGFNEQHNGNHLSLECRCLLLLSSTGRHDSFPPKCPPTLPYYTHTHLPGTQSRPRTETGPPLPPQPHISCPS